MSDPLELEARLQVAWPAERWQDVSVVVAVSGGADSVGLLRALVHLKAGGAGRLSAAHFNHALRGAESDADEQFVLALSEQLGIPCQVGRIAPGQLAEQAADGLEAAARTARYQFLQAAAATAGARYVVTAHTADDQVETIVQRIFRGTGLGGLAGMRRARPLGPATTLIRPLLGTRRSELRDYLRELGQPWREDPTNASAVATRNWLRHELLPGVVEHVSPAAEKSVLRLGQLAAEAQQVIDGLAANLALQAIKSTGAQTLVCQCALLIGQSPYVVRETFIRAWREQGWPEQSMGFDEWDALADLALRAPTAETEQRDFPGAIRAQKKGAELTLTLTRRVDR